MHGYEVLKKIEHVGDDDGRPSVTVKIINSGELHGGESCFNNREIRTEVFFYN